jgi:predicted site-specific integrase-resolvase
MYTIGQFAKLIGVSTQTLRNWDKAKILTPITLESKHRRYTDDHLAQVRHLTRPSKSNVVYCRESSARQKPSLDAQVTACKKFCETSGLSIGQLITDIGSGMNFKRKGLQDLVYLITSNKVEKLIIYHKDRLCRFGYPLIEHLCSIHGTEIVVIDQTDHAKSREEEFVEDMIAVVHHFSTRLYGSRSYKSGSDLFHQLV